MNSMVRINNETMMIDRKKDGFSLVLSYYYMEFHLFSYDILFICD